MSESNIDVVKRILELSKLKSAKRRKVYKVLNKCTEELGEIATIINKPHKKHDEDIEFEIADLMLASVDLLYVYYRSKFNCSNEDLAVKIEQMLKSAVDSKANKWNKQLQKT